MAETATIFARRETACPNEHEPQSQALPFSQLLRLADIDMHVDIEGGRAVSSTPQAKRFERLRMSSAPRSRGRIRDASEKSRDTRLTRSDRWFHTASNGTRKNESF